MIFRAAALSIVIATAVLIAGCQESTDGVPADVTAKYRTKLVAAEAPTETQTVAEVRDMLKTSESPESPQEVRMEGYIGGMPNPFGKDGTHPDFPWMAGEAGIFVIDPATFEQFKSHAHAKGEECSICLSQARAKADTVAMVHFHGEDGKSIPYRADELLSVKERSRVIVTGQATLVAGSTLVVEAESLFVEGPSGATSAE